MLKFLDKMPNNSADIILCSLKQPLPFLYTLHNSAVGTNGPCCIIYSATAIVPNCNNYSLGCETDIFCLSEQMFSGNVPCTLLVRHTNPNAASGVSKEDD